MDIDDLQGVFELLWEAEEKFPDVWRVFFSEWGEPVTEQPDRSVLQETP